MGAGEPTRAELSWMAGDLMGWCAMSGPPPRATIIRPRLWLGD